MAQLRRVATLDIDPEEAVLVDPDRFALNEVDLSVVAFRVVQDGPGRQRRKARTPATTTATKAIAYSIRRIERSSTSDSGVGGVVCRNIDRDSCLGGPRWTRIPPTS